MRNSWQRSLSETADGGEIYVLCAFNQDKAMKLPHQAGWETADLGEIAVLCALNQDEAVSSGGRKNISSLCYRARWETADGELRINICSLCSQSG